MSNIVMIILGIALVVLGTALLISWIFLPFVVAGIRKDLRSLAASQQAINRRIAAQTKK